MQVILEYFFFLAEGKSGTLFDFESDQDVTKIETTNVMAKSTVKVCTRTWYEGKVFSASLTNINTFPRKQTCISSKHMGIIRTRKEIRKVQKVW